MARMLQFATGIAIGCASAAAFAQPVTQAGVRVAPQSHLDITVVVGLGRSLQLEQEVTLAELTAYVRAITQTSVPAYAIVRLKGRVDLAPVDAIRKALADAGISTVGVVSAIVRSPNPAESEAPDAPTQPAENKSGSDMTIAVEADGVLTIECSARLDHLVARLHALDVRQIYLTAGHPISPATLFHILQALSAGGFGHLGLEMSHAGTSASSSHAVGSMGASAHPGDASVTIEGGDGQSETVMRVKARVPVQGLTSAMRKVMIDDPGTRVDVSLRALVPYSELSAVLDALFESRSGPVRMSSGVTLLPPLSASSLSRLEIAAPASPVAGLITIRAGVSGVAYLDGREVSLSGLTGILNRVERRDAQVVIRGMSSTPYGDIVGVLSAVRAAGFDNVSFEVDPDGTPPTGP